jgi:hypothetical protein
MNLIGKFVILPLSFATLATGLIQGLGTEWGLLRYYWVTVKLVLTIGSTILLLLHQFTAVADAAKRVSGVTDGTLPTIGRLGSQLVADASLAILVLLVATILSVFKPWGLTRHGQRELRKRNSVPPPPDFKATGNGLSMGFKLLLAVIVVMLGIFLALHSAGGSLGHRGH